MSKKLHIRDPRILEQVGHSLEQFADQASQILATVDRELLQFQEQLDRRVYHWERQVKQAANAVQSARLALRQCEASGYRDSEGRYHAPDCSAEMQQLEAAERHYRQCEQKLAKAKEIRSKVRQGVQFYVGESKRFSSFLNSQNQKAAGALKSAAAGYERVHQGMGRIESLRRKAVRDAWKLESELVKATGKGTRDWTQKQLERLKQGKKIPNYQGHHIRDVSSHSIKWIGDPRNIAFVTPREHFELHGGSFHNPTTGKLLDRERMIRTNRLSMRR